MKRIKYGYVYLAMGLLGLVGGAVYWHFWGCTDSCPLYSKVHWMSLRGALIGLGLAAIFHPVKKSKTQTEEIVA